MKKSSYNLIKANDPNFEIKEWIKARHEEIESKDWEPQDLSHLASAVNLFSQVEVQNEGVWEIPDFGEPVEDKPVEIPQFQEVLGESVTPYELMQRVNEIEEQAQQILEDAVEMSDEIKKEAYQEGMDRAQAEMAKYFLVLQSILEELSRWNGELVAQSEKIIFSMIEHVVQTLFGAGFQVNREGLEYVIAEALERAKAFGDLRIHLHPDDAEILEPLWLAEMAERINQRVDLIRDRGISRGGALVKGDFGEVDSRIETRTQLVMDAMKNAQQEKENGAA